MQRRAAARIRYSIDRKTGAIRLATAGDTFDVRTAILLAAVCGQTYNQFSNAGGLHVVPHGYEVTGSFEAVFEGGVKERFGFVLESADTVIAAFRGTATAIDWITDVIARQRKFPYAKNAGWTHQGFTDVYASLRSGLRAALSRARAGEKRLYVTGHSLGGALATLCALDLAAGPVPLSPIVYTFGAPRVGDAAFAAAYNRQVGHSHRVYNSYDVVPHLPPLIYKSPRTGATYHYLHVRTGRPLRFRNGSASANHVIGSYFAELARQDAAFAERLCGTTPGLCP